MCVCVCLREDAVCVYRCVSVCVSLSRSLSLTLPLFTHTDTHTHNKQTHTHTHLPTQDQPTIITSTGQWFYVFVNEYTVECQKITPPTEGVCTCVRVLVCLWQSDFRTFALPTSPPLLIPSFPPSLSLFPFPSPSPLRALTHTHREYAAGH